MAQETGLDVTRQIERQSIVMPAMDTGMLVERFKKIQELKASLLEKGDANRGDIMEITGKPYVKKSGWRKLAFAFNLTISIDKEWKEHWAGADEKGLPTDETTFYFHVRVTAPNGRYVIGVACASTDERDFAHSEHDPYALAYTRATNRAISDILGLGDVSAEEMMYSSEQRRRRTVDQAPSSTMPYKPPTATVKIEPPKVIDVAPKAPEEQAPEGQEAPQANAIPFKTIRMIQPLQPIVGDDGRTYGPYKAEDIVTIPVPNAIKLIEQGLALDIKMRQNTTPIPDKSDEPMEAPPATQGEPTPIDIQSKSGTKWGRAWLTADGARIEVDEPLNFRRADYQGLYNYFFNTALGKLIQKVAENGGKLGYDIEGTETEGATAIVLRGNIDEKQLADLVRSMVWVCERASSKKSGQS